MQRFAIIGKAWGTSPIIDNFSFFPSCSIFVWGIFITYPSHFELVMVYSRFICLFIYLFIYLSIYLLTRFNYTDDLKSEG